jgi:RimJ/RimL family protein N-acetyltransferase
VALASATSCPPPTARLVFRTWRDEDLPLARALFGDPQVTALVGGPFSDAQIAARLAGEIATQAAHGYQYWPMFARGITEDLVSFVGCCGLKPRDPAANIHELGVYIRPHCWNQGYAAEAARAVIAFAFDTLGASGLFAGHHPDNAGSKRTLEKLGFRYTGDELYPPTGLMHPGYQRSR